MSACSAYGRKGAAVADRDYETFWARERDGLYRALAMTLDDPGLAGEAVDEAMVRAYQRWDRVSGYDRPGAWVYRVALNWATSTLRKLSLRPTRSRDDLDRPHRDALPDVDLAEQLRRLSHAHRAVLVLRYYLELTPGEIAHLLDVPAGTVKSRLHRAVEQLRANREEDAHDPR